MIVRLFVIWNNTGLADRWILRYENCACRITMMALHVARFAIAIMWIPCEQYVSATIAIVLINVRTAFSHFTTNMGWYNASTHSWNTEPVKRLSFE